MVKDSTTAFRLAILGLLADSPMHGYELRQKVSTTLGSLRVFSYGSLYPTLRRLQDAGEITTDAPTAATEAGPLLSRRSRVVYRLTEAGRTRLDELLGDSGPHSSSDDGFEVHLAFFARTSSEVRLRILQSRRRRLQERCERLRQALGKATEQMDAYTDQLRRLGLESADREVHWLDELIESEMRGKAPPSSA